MFIPFVFFFFSKNILLYVGIFMCEWYDWLSDQVPFQVVVTKASD
jgi:hypothetical protein